METPPNNSGAARPNFMQFRRGDAQEDIVKNDKNEMMMKFGPKYTLYKKELPVNTERDNVNKIMTDLRKHSQFLKETKWMFENNSCLHIDNYSPNPL